MLRYLLPLSLTFSCFCQTIDESHELLWEISGNGLQKNSYLFGTLHSNEKRIFNLSDSTYYAMVAANTFSLETDIFSLFETWDTRIESVEVLYDNKGKPYINTSEATETQYGDEDGMPQFLDAFFQWYCHNSDKNFVPLESTESQLNLFSEINLPDHSNFRWETILTSKDEMVDLYLKGDIYKIDDLLKTSLSLYAHGYQGLILDRNINMAERIDSLLKLEDNVLFCAVGAGHLASNGGLINLLRQKGYTMRKVTASYSHSPTRERKAVYAKRNYMYNNDTIGIHVRFPGKPEEISSEEEIYALKLIYREFGQGNTYDVEVYYRTEEIGLEALARTYIASPVESQSEKIILDNGGEAFQGMADSYPEGLYWVRILMNEDYFVVVKSYGGNKFMNSRRAHKFFENVWFD